MIHGALPRFVLCALDDELAWSWTVAFAGVDAVLVHRGDMLGEGPLDLLTPSERAAVALVSPANSFGFMDGGFDLVLSQRLGWHVEERVRQRILDEEDGELPVGGALFVPTDHPTWPWLASVPTMRVPMRLDGTVNAYLAFRGLLRAVRRHNAGEGSQVTAVLCPGLGTGEGRMPPGRCARQMRRAWEVVVEGRPVRLGGLAGAVRDHMALLE